VTADSFDSLGSFEIEVDTVAVASTAFCNSATSVLDGGYGTYFGQGSTTLAVPIFSHMECQIDESNKGMWYVCTPINDALVTMRLEMQQFNAQLSDFSGSCDALVCGWSVSADDCTISELDFSATGGTSSTILSYPKGKTQRAECVDLNLKSVQRNHKTQSQEE